MTISYQGQVRIVDEVLVGDDVVRLATVFDSMRQMRMPIGLVEPERILVKKRRLLPDVYLGATTPTQRWSCQWQIAKDETIPGI